MKFQKDGFRTELKKIVICLTGPFFDRLQVKQLLPFCCSVIPNMGLPFYGSKWLPHHLPSQPDSSQGEGKSAYSFVIRIYFLAVTHLAVMPLLLTILPGTYTSHP